MTPNNHTIPINDFVSSQNGTIIVMPRYHPLSVYANISIRMALKLGPQLLEAVQFMHSNGLAHLDLKPENIVVDLLRARLFVIDYDSAVEVDDVDDCVSGFFGTEGFTAPEVGDETNYSAIRADLWATGNVLQSLLFRCKDLESSELGTLWRISNMLMADNPRERPTADYALAMLYNSSLFSTGVVGHASGSSP
jgi:serine/threonine protein kinase